MLLNFHLPLHVLSLLLYTLTCTARTITPRSGTLEQITSFGSNPTNVKMYIYVPTNLAPNPAIVVAIHYCTGTAQAFYGGTPYAQASEKHNFIVIYPESPYEGKCWDVSSQATLTHNGGGNSNSIANMVDWTVKKYGADKKRVFAVGMSSGAMMTNVLAATYPDIFAAGIAYAGVPAGCFLSTANQPDAWNSTCSQGQSITSPQHWADIAKAMYPGYSGSRPKMQIYHGSADTTLNVRNYQETCKQWAGVLGYQFDAPKEKKSNTPEANYETTVWGEKLVGVLASGIGHNIPIHGEEDLKWFGFV
ncbi:alpha/beta hydrolase family esterase [Aspergillus alliaceus]|uniref:alpha/beta hydrolase family esterase n=1 Tax=Petromyces alliaceus TaxID=209559 RepID=UPI0012A3B2C9|nr:putative acetylxylan esterase A [Aspergillus alliaceus]KAB8227066.1 putative acetylxylan esterase A [Aspergillus alliaceus]